MNLNEMTAKQLREEAAKRGIKVRANARKAEIIAAIEESSEPVHVVAEVIDPEEQAKPCKNLIARLPGDISITSNIEALNAYVEEQIAPYVGATFDITDDKQVTEARKCMADLNSLKKPIEEERKRIKREYEAPLKSFEGLVKGITEKIDSARSSIKEQVDKADEAFGKRRYDNLSAFYAEYAELLVPVVPYTMLHDPRWCNRSVKYEDAQDELESKINKVATDWESLKTLGLEFFDAAEAHFFRTLDLGEAVDYNAKLVASRKKIDDLKEQVDPVRDDSVADAVPAAPVACEPAAAVQPAPTPMCAPAPVSKPLPVQPQIQMPLIHPPAMNIADDPPKPRVMVIDSATIEQCQRIGKFCGSIGVTGKFVPGTLSEAFRRERAREIAAMEGVVSYV